MLTKYILHTLETMFVNLKTRWDRVCSIFSHKQ